MTSLPFLPVLLGDERMFEHRTGVNARVELTVFAARVDTGRQFLQQTAIELAADEGGVEGPRIDARHPRAQTAAQHLARQAISRDTPGREQRLEPRAGQFLHSIAAHVLEK